MNCQSPVLIWSFDWGKQCGFFFTLHSSLTSPSEADPWSRLLAWAQVTGEILILILLFGKGRSLALSVLTGPLVTSVQLGGLDLPTWPHTGCCKVNGQEQQSLNTTPAVSAFMKYQKVTEVTLSGCWKLCASWGPLTGSLWSVWKGAWSQTASQELLCAQR